MAASLLLFTVSSNPIPSSSSSNDRINRTQSRRPLIQLSGWSSSSSSSWCSVLNINWQFPSISSRCGACFVLGCLPSSSPKATSSSRTRLYISGLSFRTTEESLRNAFQNFGQLVEVNLVMDKIANRPRGFAFLRYATEEESQKAIEGMHGKFLDGRVIFVEVAKPRSELRRGLKQNPMPY